MCSATTRQNFFSDKARVEGEIVAIFRGNGKGGEERRVNSGEWSEVGAVGVGWLCKFSF